MRITNSTVTRRYLHNLETNMYKKAQSENKVASNRKYSRASEDPINAAKALRVRKSVSELETYQTNLKTAKSIYAEAESALMGVSNIIKNTYEQLIYGANGTQGDAENQIIGDNIKTYADEMMRLMNVVVADRRIFGGTNNHQTAYSISSSAGGSTVFYNGKPVNSFQDPSHFPYSATSYTDIGIGMQLFDDGSIDPQSALPVTFNGVEVLGCGLSNKITTFELDKFVDGGQYSLDVYLGKEKRTIEFEGGADVTETLDTFNQKLEEAFGVGVIKVDETGVAYSSVLGDVGLTFENSPYKESSDPDFVAYDKAQFKETPTGYPNNIIQLTLDAAEVLKSGDKESTAKYADALFAIQTNLLLVIADIGNKDQFIDFNTDRITNNLFTLSEQQNDLEHTDYGSEVTNWRVMESVFSATLQMSAKVIPMSIFNFM